MKLISLNTLGATQGDTFFAYIKENAKDTDIFCFQEIFSAPQGVPEISSGACTRLFQELSGMLQEFEGIFAARSSGYDFNGPVDFPLEHGVAVFIRKHIQVINSRIEEMGTPAGTGKNPVEGKTIAQVFNLAGAGKPFCVVNYHGPALPGDKLDSPERIANSRALGAIWENLGAKAKILCGDFNLMPEIESVKILDHLGRDLIKEFKITNTRNEISWDKYHNKQYFADYTFTSPEVNVKSFEVPYSLVSDHLPMVLEFEI